MINHAKRNPKACKDLEHITFKNFEVSIISYCIVYDTKRSIQIRAFERKN